MLEVDKLTTRLTDPMLIEIDHIFYFYLKEGGQLKPQHSILSRDGRNRIFFAGISTADTDCDAKKEIIQWISDPNCLGFHNKFQELIMMPYRYSFWPGGDPRRIAWANKGLSKYSKYYYCFYMLEPWQ